VVMDNGSASNQPYTVNVGGNKGGFNKSRVNGYDKYKNPQFMQELASDSNLNPNYQFDNYIEGDCNRLARSAGFAVANKPGITSFNPFMVYGGVGLGKTHLIQAIGNEIKRNHPEKYVFYVASEKFTNQFIDALKSNSLQEFIAYYRNVDVLMLDDVQFLKDKEKTQVQSLASIWKANHHDFGSASKRFKWSSRAIGLKIQMGLDRRYSTT